MLSCPVFVWTPSKILNELLKGCLHENSFCLKKSIKLISVVQSYHNVIFKLLNCNSIAVLFLYFYLSKHEICQSLLWWLLNFWIIINFRKLWKTNIVLCVQHSWKTSLQNFAKIFPFTDILYLISFLTKSWEKWHFYKHQARTWVTWVITLKKFSQS